MRPSNRQKMLDASIEIIERDGVSGLTYESVAEEMGMTKGGIMHHFPTRESLVTSMYEYIASTWEREMEELAGKSAEEATEHERLKAYIAAGATSATRAQLLLALEGVHTPEFTDPLNEVVNRWTPDIGNAPLPPEEVRKLVARLASDGLWLLEAWSPGNAPSAEIKQQVVAYINESLMDSDT